MPAFDQHPEEGAIVGRLVAGYGELEIDLALLVSTVLDDRDAGFKAIFRAPGEVGRIVVGDGLIRHKVPAGKLLTIYCEGIAAMHECRKIRNQYAHCQWWNEPAGLQFMALQESMEGHALFSLVELQRHTLELDVLEEQEAYFCYAQDCFTFVRQEIEKASGIAPANPHFAAPQSKPKPRRHS